MWTAEQRTRHKVMERKERRDYPVIPPLLERAKSRG